MEMVQKNTATISPAENRTTQWQWRRGEGGIANSLTSSHLTSSHAQHVFTFCATIHLLYVSCSLDNITFCKSLYYTRLHHPELIQFPTICDIINQLVSCALGKMTHFGHLKFSKPPTICFTTFKT